MLEDQDESFEDRALCLDQEKMLVHIHTVSIVYLSESLLLVEKHAKGKLKPRYMM